jgi:uncharacterized protein YjaZ
MANEYEIGIPKSINIIGFEHEPIDNLFIHDIAVAYDELKSLLPSLPDRMNIIFGSNYDYGEDGVTGSAISNDTIKVGIRPDVDDRTKQFSKIRSLVFHEGFHIAQGFHLESRFSALESAIYEGCATVFEREYAHSAPKWADYSKESIPTLLRWRDEMKGITAEQYSEPTGETWKKWAFYDPETDESWRIYKVGTWLMDTILKDTGSDITEFSTKNANEILGISI